MRHDIPVISVIFQETVINIVAISILVIYLAYIWINSKKTILLQHYLVMNLLAILVLVSNFIITVAPGENIKWICIVTAFIMKSCFDVLFFCYGYYFLNRKHLSNKLLYLVMIYPISCLLIILLNPVHHLYVTWQAIPNYDYGILFYIISAAGYAFQFTGTVFIYSFPIGRHKTYIYKLIIIVITFAVFTLQFLFTSKVLYSPIDINPILLLIIFTFLFFSAYRFGLLNTLSLGIIRSLEMFSEAVLVFDTNGNILHKNKACNMYDCNIIDYVITECRNILKGSSEAALNLFKEEIKFAEYNKILSISIQPIMSILGKRTGYVCVMNDNTDIVTAINELEEKNQQLEEMNESIKMLSEDIERLTVLEERSILAGEIHDVLGHSLNYALSVLESNKIIIDKYPKKAIQRLNQAVIDIDTGLDEISAASVNKVNKSPKGFYMFCKSLREMAKKLCDIGIIVEIAANEDLNVNDDRIYKTIYRVCQEAVTNSIKHGQADRVTISIKKRAGIASLYIVDNGKGCVSFTKGNGLSGMEVRINKIGGNIVFCNFDDNKGFLVHASIPLM